MSSDFFPVSLDSNRDRWARLLDETARMQPNWSPADLSSMLRHLLSSPVAFDWPGDTAPCENQEDRVAASLPLERENSMHVASQQIRSFSELFHNPSPPLYLLRQTHVFAKKHLQSPEHLLPFEIAAVLYYASILLARRHHREEISSLDGEAFSSAISWVLSQEWIDEPIKTLFRGGA